MLLVCVLVLTNTVSADGSISGMYRAGIQLAERAYTGGAGAGDNSAPAENGIKGMVEGVPAILVNGPTLNLKKVEPKPGGAAKAPEKRDQK
jgi:hypothetical protein